MKKIKEYKSTLELIKLFRWDSLIFKFAKDIAFYVFIPFIIICLFVFFFYTSEWSRKNTEEFSSVSSYINSDISNSLEKIQENVSFMATSRIVCNYLNIDDLENYNHQNYREYIETKGILKAFAVASENVDDIYLYSYASDFLISSGLSVPDDDYILGLLKKNEKNNFFWGNDGKIYVVKDINYKSGIAVFAVDCGSFLKSYSEYGLAFKNKDGEDFFKNGDYNLTSDKEGFFKENGRFFSVKNYGDIKTVVFKETKSGQLAKNMAFLILVCFLIVGISAALVLIILSLTFYQNIEEVIRIIHDNDFKKEYKKTNEISYIVRNIRRISDENDSLSNTMVKNFLEIKKLNSVVLQNQISPHFLMNTLNTVNLIILSVTKKKNDATTAVSLLSELFGDVLNTNVYTFTIEEEISYCNKYLAIEKILDDSFEVTYSVDEKIKDVNIPKLLLQPIIENSIRHGIKRLDEDEHGKILIEAKKIGDIIKITVSDNGPDGKENAIYEINEKLKKSDGSDAENYKDGLFNVNRRIKLLYGDNYGVKIERKEKNTVVTITIPLQKY